jgi:hypothetical protein
MALAIKEEIGGVLVEKKDAQVSFRGLFASDNEF